MSSFLKCSTAAAAMVVVVVLRTKFVSLGEKRASQEE